MVNAVRWYKSTSEETAIVQVFENGRWVNARNSRIYTADVDFRGSFGNASEGFATFQKALKLGYENKGLFIADVIKED
jgi:hypothetical protein